MEEKKSRNTLMILLTALGALAIIILFGWIAFFNPMDNMNTVEKPELALSSLEGADVNLLPEKSAEELLLDGLQKGEETPLIMDEEQGDIQISMDEPPEEEKVPAAAVKPAETKPVPKVTYKDVTEDIYWLQVGSFPNSVSADNLRASLKARGIDSVMQTREVNGTLYYRVRVGAFSEKGEAEAFKEKLIALKEIEEVTLYTDKITKSVPVN
ncbi:MAG: SPOR domain-containing protein [Spirochaetales bacterium]|nr:SPOR domain-containing protein [Spirochaetales bacterium]